MIAPEKSHRDEAGWLSLCLDQAAFALSLADPLSSYTSGTTVAVTGGKPLI
jgi:hypothetical protein